MFDGRRQARTAAIGCAVAIMGASVAACGGERHGVTAPDVRVEPPVVLVDADSDGAVLVDGRDRTARGVRRNGDTAWRATLDNAAAVPVSCLSACPDALLSGSVAATNDGSTSDPEPVLILGGRRLVLAGPPGPNPPRKRRVLAATGVHDLVLSTVDSTGRPWLEVRRRGSVDRIPVGGGRTSWSMSGDLRHALAVTEVAPGRSEARWFDRDASGWRVAAGSVRVAGHASCVAPAGDRAILLGQPPIVLYRTGAQRDITDLDAVGTCAFAATGAILVALTQRPSGPEARVRVVDDTGRITWTADVRHDVRVSADPTGARVAYVAAGTLHELDPRTGAETRTVPDVRAARYDDAGELVVLRPDLRVAWLA